MPFKTKCPICQNPLQVPSRKAGTKVNCPICGKAFQAPALDQPVAEKHSTAVKPPRPPEAAPKKSTAIPFPPKKEPAAERAATPSQPASPQKPPPLPKKSSRPESRPSDHPPSAESPAAETPSAETLSESQPPKVANEKPASTTAPAKSPEPPEKLPAAREKPTARQEKPPAEKTPTTAARAASAGPVSPPDRVDPPDRPSEPPSKPPEPTGGMPKPSQPTFGVEHDRHRKATVYQFGLGLMAVAVFGILPAVFDIVDHFRSVQSAGISPWAFVLLLAGLLQAAYAVYVMQVPDWSTLWIASIFTLVLATAYAMFLAIALLASTDSQIIQFLGLTDKLHGNKATGWCFIMASLSSLICYLGGRVSVRWHQADQRFTGAAAGKS